MLVSSTISAEEQQKWDYRFLEMAKLVASWSKDPSTKCGAVIIRPDRTIVSSGYNGFPKGCHDEPALYADRETKYARVVHAEVNAILFAREPLHGYTMYTWPAGAAPTCDRCATNVIQSGITRVVHVGGTFGEGRWADSMHRALQMYKEAGTEIVQLGTPE